MRINKDHLPWETKSQLLWVCPECSSVNAWNADDAIRAGAKLKGGVFISHGSCFDNVCGNPNCQANIARSDSPINSPCYNHSED